MEGCTNGTAIFCWTRAHLFYPEELIQHLPAYEQHDKCAWIRATAVTGIISEYGQLAQLCPLGGSCSHLRDRSCLGVSNETSASQSVKQHWFQFSSTHQSVISDSCVSIWVTPATSSRAATTEPLLALQEKTLCATAPPNHGAAASRCSCCGLVRAQGGAVLALALCRPCQRTGEGRVPPGGVPCSPFRSNHHLKEGFWEGKKNKIITMVIPVTASEINLSKNSRNTGKKKPVKQQSLWEQGFTKEDYKFPSGLNKVRCSQFCSF